MREIEGQKWPSFNLNARFVIKPTLNFMRYPLSLSPVSRIIIALVIVSFISYWPSHRNGFIEWYDDLEYIVNNPAVHAGLTWDGLKWAFLSNHSANWHPLTWLSHMADCRMYGIFLLRGLTGAFWRSAFVAGLFALHPLHVESVAWIAERKDVLSTFFLFLTLLVYHRYTISPRKRTYLLMVIVFASGLMSKPMLVTMPCIMLAMDFWPLGRCARTGRSWRWLVVEKIPLFLLSAASAVMTIRAQEAWSAIIPLHRISLLDRFANSAVAYLVYLGKMFVPMDLAVFYPLPDHYPVWRIGLALVALVTITAIVIGQTPKRPWALFGWLWYIGTLVPVIGIVQVGNQAFADRYTYIPLIGIFIMVAWLAAEGYSHCGKGMLAVIVGAVIVWLAMFSILTVRQVSLWKDSYTLFGHTLKVTHDNYPAHCLYGVALLSRGQYAAALNHFHEAATIKPAEVRVHVNYGLAYEGLKNYEAAIGEYRAAIRVDPRDAKAYRCLGVALIKNGNTQEAISYLQQAIDLDSTSLAAYANLASAHERLGNVEEAIGCLTNALRIDPANIQCSLNRGRLMYVLGRCNAAIKDFGHVLKLAPDHYTALRFLGLAYDRLGDCDSSAVYFSAAFDHAVSCSEGRTLIDSIHSPADRPPGPKIPPDSPADAVILESTSK
jgi:Flp pilus assembly protein TadD